MSRMLGAYGLLLFFVVSVRSFASEAQTSLVLIASVLVDGGGSVGPRDNPVQDHVRAVGMVD